MSPSNVCILFLVVLHLSKGHPTKSIFQPLAEFISSQTQPYVVPQTDPTKPLIVDVQMGVLDLEEVDDRRNELWMRSWFMAIWNSSITWNPEDYNGLSSLVLPAMQGYVPQIGSLVSAGHHEILSPVSTRYLSHGIAMFFASVRWKILCDLSKDDSCPIRLYSSDYSNDVIQLRHPDKRLMNMNALLAQFRFEKSPYEIVSERYTHGSEAIKDIPGSHDWIEYTFSFRKRRSAHWARTAVFEW